MNQLCNKLLLFIGTLLVYSCSNDNKKVSSSEDSATVVNIKNNSVVVLGKTGSNKKLVEELRIIYQDDQFGGRDELKGTGYDKQLWRKIEANDYKNLEKVKSILETYGWLSADEVGDTGNQALFLVIQHADILTQEKYLPMMKEAVKKGNARPQDFALLVDRVEMRNGRPQVYGSQLVNKNGKTTLYPIIDSINVNKRRAEVGLESLEEYLQLFARYEPVNKFDKK
ncbi:MAG: DUF6624 domain-containing protein [Bacteroidia bacterium]